VSKDKIWGCMMCGEIFQVKLAYYVSPKCCASCGSSLISKHDETKLLEMLEHKLVHEDVKTQIRTMLCNA
jgi:hypothetical protein